MLYEDFEIWLRITAHTEPTARRANHVFVDLQRLRDCGLENVIPTTSLCSRYVCTLCLALALPKN